ncbi:MAG: sulfotransferase family 2 domain-containing protein [Bacteroidota bacterium]
MLIFVHIEKTAGTSLKFIFRNSFGIKHCDSLKNKKKIFTQKDLDYAKQIFGKIKCVSGHNLVEPTRHLNEPGLMFLTFLRDPITRSASFYQDHCLRGKHKVSFEAWMNDDNKHNMQTKMIAGGEDVEKAKRLLRDYYFFVGLTERFDDSLKLLSIVCPEKLNLKYKKKLMVQDNSIKNELINTTKTLQILKDTNKLDLELYNYVSNDLFPERLKAHDKELDKVTLPETYYKTHNTFNYQVSIGFNKFIYRQVLKVKKNK